MGLSDVSEAVQELKKMYPRGCKNSHDSPKYPFKFRNDENLQLPLERGDWYEYPVKPGSKLWNNRGDVEPGACRVICDKDWNFWVIYHDPEKQKVGQSQNHEFSMATLAYISYKRPYMYKEGDPQPWQKDDTKFRQNPWSTFKEEWDSSSESAGS